MEKKYPWYTGLSKTLQDKVIENARGHNLQITTRDTSGRILAFCPYQTNKPSYIIFAGSPAEIKNRMKSMSSQTFIPTYDKEIAILPVG